MSRPQLSDPVYAGMATLPDRWEHLDEVLRHILPNVGRLYVYVDDPVARLPEHLARHPKVFTINATGKSLGDAGKFFGIFEFGAFPAYWLTIDDDLFYPEDYVRHMIGWVDQYDRRALVTIAGAVVQEPCTSYYSDARRERYHYSQGVQMPTPVNVPGTGVSAFHSSTVHPTSSDFPVRNMGDIWLGRWCHERMIPQVVVPHPPAWFPHAPIDLDETIWAWHKGDDAVQTATINAHQWTVIRP